MSFCSLITGITPKWPHPRAHWKCPSACSNCRRRKWLDRVPFERKKRIKWFHFWVAKIAVSVSRKTTRCCQLYGPSLWKEQTHQLIPFLIRIIPSSVCLEKRRKRKEKKSHTLLSSIVRAFASAAVLAVTTVGETNRMICFFFFFFAARIENNLAWRVLGQGAGSTHPLTGSTNICHSCDCLKSQWCHLPACTPSRLQRSSSRQSLPFCVSCTFVC